MIASAQPHGQGAISGSVIEASSGDPVRKAVVTVTWQGTPRSWATTRTDGSGQFKFEGLPPGKYDLRASKLGLGTATYGSDRLRELGDFITLGDGETVQGLKLRFIRSGSIAGRVIDPDGDPIAGVNVTLLRPGRNRGERVLSNYRGASTNDLGDYRITGVDPGSYYLSSHPNVRRGGRVVTMMRTGGQAVPDRPTEILVGQYYPGARDAKDAALVTVHDGESLTGLDFHLFTEPTIQVHGRVTGVPDPGPPPNPDRPVMGRMNSDSMIQVSFAPAEEGQQQQWNNSVIAQPPEYRFEFSDAPSGRYRIEAIARGKDKTYSASQLLDLHQGTGDITLALVPAVELKGRLQIEGQITEPVSRFSITLTGVGRETLSGHVGADGRFTIPDVRQGEWAFNIDPVPLKIFLKDVHLGDQDVRFKSLWIEPGSNVPLNIVISTRTATIEGEIDGAGSDSKRAGILLAPFGKNHTLTRFYYSAVAHDDGKFKMEGIAPGTYKIFALEKITTANYRTPEAADQLAALGEDIEIAEGVALQLHPKLIPAEKAREALGQ